MFWSWGDENGMDPDEWNPCLYWPLVRCRESAPTPGYPKLPFHWGCWCSKRLIRYAFSQQMVHVSDYVEYQERQFDKDYRVPYYPAKEDK